jgi:hypothetical protein
MEEIEEGVDPNGPRGFDPTYSSEYQTAACCVAANPLGTVEGSLQRVELGG